MADYSLTLSCDNIDEALLSARRRSYYVCDPDESDQGAAGSGNSLKDLVDTIGTNKNATIFFAHHPGQGNTTTYTLSTSETVPSNIHLEMMPGVLVTGGGTLTINGSILAGMYQVFSSSLDIDGEPKIMYILPQWFGAVGDGSTDDTDAIQAALDMANNLDGATTTNVVLFPFGTYKITDTLTWYKGTCMEGIHNSQGSGNRFPEISWFGSAGGTMIQTEDGYGNRAHKYIRNLTIRNGSGHTDQPDYGVVIQDRADLGTSFEDFQALEMDKNGLYFEEGGINVHMRNVRFDSCAEYAIYWRVGGSDNMSIDGFTVDNNRSDLAESGGAVHFDLSNLGNNYEVTSYIANGTLEANDDLASGEAFFKYTIDPDNSQRVQTFAAFVNVRVAPAGGVTEYDGVLITPEYDFAMLSLMNCEMSVVGVPHYQNHMSTSRRHSLTVINPHGLVPGLSPGTEQSVTNFVGSTSLDHVYQFGEKAIMTTYKAYDSSDWDNHPVTVYAGQWFFDPTRVNLEVRKVDEVVTSGTLGTLSGVTGSGSSGQAEIVMNDASGLRIGQYISIGADDKYIVHIDESTDTVTVQSNLANTHSGAAVSFIAPTFRQHQLLSKASSAPASGTHAQGDVVFNSGAAASGTVGWVCTAAGTPGTWKAFGTIAA